MSNTNYPGALDTPTNPGTGDTLASVPHHLQHGLENDAIVAIETKLGTGASLQTPTTNGFLIGTGTGASQWQPSPTSPSFTTSILDTNNRTWIGQTAIGTAVNYLNVANAATTGTPILSALGSDSNINLNLVPKGSGKIQDNGTNLIDFRSAFTNFVQAGGGVWSIQSGLAGNMTAVTLFIAGVEYTNALVTGHTFAASSDTYVDYTVGTGITYNAVANNAASFALAANSIRLAIIVTSGSAITSINQGQFTVTAPVASSVIYSVSDSLGNLIYPTSPGGSGTWLAYRQSTATFTSTTNTAVQIPALSLIATIPAGRKAEVFFFTSDFSANASATTPIVEIWDGAVGGTRLFSVESNTLAGANDFGGGSGSYPVQPNLSANTTKTYNASLRNTAAVSTSMANTTTNPAWLGVKLT